MKTDLTIANLIEAVVPHAADALALRGDAAKEAAKHAVRNAAVWFCGPDVETLLDGYELSGRQVGWILDDFGEARELPPEDVTTISMGVQTLSDGVQIAATRLQYGDGWIRPMPMTQANAEAALRSDIQILICCAVLLRTQDRSAAWAAQERSAGLELDAKALVASVGEPVSPSRSMEPTP